MQGEREREQEKKQDKLKVKEMKICKMNAGRFIWHLRTNFHVWAAIVRVEINKN